MDIDEHMRHFRRGMEQAAKVASDPICSEYWKRDGEDKPVDRDEVFKNRKFTLILKNSNRRFTGLTLIETNGQYSHYRDGAGNDYILDNDVIAMLIAAPSEPAGE